MTRDSMLWTILFLSGMAGFLVGHEELLTKAFPAMSMAWQSRIELISALLGFVGGYLKMSPAPLSPTNELATRKSATTINPLQQPGDSGVFHPGDFNA